MWISLYRIGVLALLAITAIGVFYSIDTFKSAKIEETSNRTYIEAIKQQQQDAIDKQARDLVAKTKLRYTAEDADNDRARFDEKINLLIKRIEELENR